MPQRKTALKALHKRTKKTRRNTQIKQRLKGTVKLFLTVLDSKDTEKSKKQLPSVYSQLDKAAKKKTIHKKRASRQKSRLTKRLNKASRTSKT